ncbi:cell division protein FtsK [Bacillus cereus]|nr:cell division protein FtsK [Bacillus cereus]
MNSMLSWIELSEKETEKYYEEAKQCVIAMQAASVTMIQRRFRIGYRSAKMIIDRLEKNGVISPYNGKDPRKSIN